TTPRLSTLSLHDALPICADQFGLAACLYEVLTGRPPFEADTVMDTLRNVISIMPPAPSLHSLPVPSALDGVILRALSKDPDDRRSEEHTSELQSRENLVC